MVVNVCNCLTRVRGSVESALAWLGTTGKKEKRQKKTLQPVVSSGSNLDDGIYSPARTAAADDDVEIHVPGCRLTY